MIKAKSLTYVKRYLYLAPLLVLFVKISFDTFRFSHPLSEIPVSGLFNGTTTVSTDKLLGIRSNDQVRAYEYAQSKTTDLIEGTDVTLTKISQRVWEWVDNGSSREVFIQISKSVPMGETALLERNTPLDAPQLSDKVEQQLSNELIDEYLVDCNSSKRSNGVSLKVYQYCSVYVLQQNYLIGASIIFSSGDDESFEKFLLVLNDLPFRLQTHIDNE